MHASKQNETDRLHSRSSSYGKANENRVCTKALREVKQETTANRD